MYQDREIYALSSVYESIKGLNQDQIKRIIEWVTDKFALDQPQAFQAVQREVAPSPLEPVTDEVAALAAKPVKKRRGRPPGKAKTIVEETPPQPVASKINGLIKYNTLEELFAASNIKKNAAKILLAAAYLQEKENLKEISIDDIISSLRKVGAGVYNTSYAIISLMTKKPPHLVQMVTKGAFKHSKRKFKVTEEGLKIARNYINE